MQAIRRNIKSKTFLSFVSFVGISSFLVLPLISISSAHASSSFEYQVNVNTSLNVAVSSPTVSLTLNPSITPFASTDLDVTVGTNNPWGYRLYINADSTDLLNDTYAEDAYINTLSSSTTESTFAANKWGYRISGLSTGVTADDSITDTDTKTNFYPFVSDTLIGQTSVPSNEANTKLTFGAKVNYERPAGVYTLDFTFRTVPTVTTLSMQDLDGDVCTTTPTIVTDSRDGQSYAIARLADGKCWMLQNLKLGKTEDNIVLTTTDSDIESGSFTLSSNEAGAEGKFPSVSRADDTVAGGTVYVKDKSEYYCTDYYGCYYNWYTATAGSGKGEGSTATEPNATVDYSICPKGWSLPTGGSGGDFQTLATAYSRSATNMRVGSPTTTTENINGQYSPGLLLSGYYSSIGAGGLGADGLYWSRTSYSTGHAYSLYLNTSGVDPLNHNYKHRGFAVRCLLQEP